jgi:hypothetical protein
MSCLVCLEQMQELGISSCNGVGATTVAKVIAANLALPKLTFGGDGQVLNQEEAAMVPAQPPTLGVGMTEE